MGDVTKLDLISRDAVIHSLLDFVNGKKTLGQCIDDIPTAYNVNKVVEQLAIIEDMADYKTYTKALGIVMKGGNDVRLVDIEDVVKMVDKHTNDDMTLDDDITCILEDVPTAYDVDRVLEEIEKLKIPYAFLTQAQEAINRTSDRAIEIVKGGK